ncbi:hypothetical protein [Streptomyces endophyticus]|uniref:Albusnodin family lasso peptide n=1 Tax=Streptomyces endophyticus TaxID=714166 RepID=A0ABU6F206_9ACTN|nr:hypothetical protein [Streptomyces endophyticus]MEB8338035.1 hypothetical protein [Streptomyces endophyticus]
MSAIAVEITERPAEKDKEKGQGMSKEVADVEFVDDLDILAGGDVMRGCGDDNPYN